MILVWICKCCQDTICHLLPASWKVATTKSWNHNSGSTSLFRRRKTNSGWESSEGAGEQTNSQTLARQVCSAAERCHKLRPDILFQRRQTNSGGRGLFVSLTPEPQRKWRTCLLEFAFSAETTVGGGGGGGGRGPVATAQNTEPKPKGT